MDAVSSTSTKRDKGEKAQAFQEMKFAAGCFMKCPWKENHATLALLDGIHPV
jgi:hypothetical protein